MTPRTRRSAGVRSPADRPDPLEGEIERALQPGRFVSRSAGFEFLSGLEAVAARIGAIVRTAPGRAVALYEAFLAGCYEKAEEYQDWGRDFGPFVETLFCGWIRARQAADANRDETAARLLAWMDDDPYSFCDRLEEEAAKAFDRAGLAAFERQVRGRLDAAVQASSEGSASTRWDADAARRRWGDVLRTLYRQRKDVAAYEALAEETGLTVQDCRALATMLVARRKPDQALRWIERGLELNKNTPHGSVGGHDLASLKRTVLTKLGRKDEALEAAWAEYREHPNRFSYADLMAFVPKADRAEWHAKALEAAMGTDLHALIELLLETKELGRLAERLAHASDEALEGVTHFATEPAAKRLEKAHPDMAARLWRAQGVRILKAKKSKYYAAALRNFARARRCYERAGLPGEWQRLVDEIQTEHRRKTGFVVDFLRMAEGAGLRAQPSFLDRAKARWSQRRLRSREP
jgi:tetratricopeptide (TPR) repeat protein